MQPCFAAGRRIAQAEVLELGKDTLMLAMTASDAGLAC